MIDRITILGGSSVYTPELILSIIARNINVKEIVLFGRPGRKLDLVTAFCQRLMKKSGFPAKVLGVSDLEEAVTGAKYILNHIRVGGMSARMRDEMLPPKLGMIGDETLGAGGIANAMRTLPIVFEFAETIERVNPEAYFINVSNPIGILVEGLIKYSKLNVLGVDDLPGKYIRKIIDVLQVDANRVQADYFGLNHLGWIQDVKIDNRSKMSQLLELLEKHEEEGFDYDLIEVFRMIPTRHTGMYYSRGEVLRKQQACSRFRSELLHEAEQQILKLYEDPHLNEVPELTRQRNAVWYEETVLPVIEALEGNKEKVLVLCMRNDGAIRDLPANCSVEVPARVANGVFEGRKVGSLPGFLKGVFLAQKESDRLTVEAIRHKSYDYALQALAVSPFVPSVKAAKEYLKRIVKEEKLELH